METNNNNNTSTTKKVKVIRRSTTNNQGTTVVKQTYSKFTATLNDNNIKFLKVLSAKGDIKNVSILIDTLITNYILTEHRNIQTITEENYNDSIRHDKPN